MSLDNPDLQKKPSPRSNRGKLPVVPPSDTVDAKAQPYKGWIPNVAGRLSFSHIGQTRFPRPCTTLNEDDGEGRSIVCIQKRTLSDALIAARYMQWVYGYDPNWVFVFIAQSGRDGRDRIGTLEGSVYIFNTAGWRGDDEQEISPSAASQALVEYVDSPPPQAITTHAARLRERIPQLMVQYGRDCVARFNCRVTRFGEVDIYPVVDVTKVLFAPAVLQPPRTLEIGDLRYLANQAYFFLKDISHQHKHHHKHSDTITSAHMDDDRISWARETQYSMHRHLVSMRRRKDPKSVYNAMGMLAYMKAFDAKKGNIIGCDPEDASLDYNISEIESSLKAQAEGMKWQRAQLNIMLTAIPAILIGLAAILNNRPVDAPHTLFSAGKAALSAIFPVDVYGCMTLIGILLLTPMLYAAFNPMTSGPVLRAKRILTVWPRRHQARCWMLVGVFIAAIAGIIVFTALQYPTVNIKDWAWLAVVIGFAFLPVSVLILPYLLTLPDLVDRLRGKPRPWDDVLP